MSVIYFLVTAAVLMVVFRISRKKMILLRKEVWHMVPYHDRFEILRLRILIVFLWLGQTLCMAGLFGLCLYQTISWRAAP